MHFYLHNQYLSIPKGFEWKNIPDFAIVIGKNGSGKSQLLEIICRGIRHLSNENEEYIDKDDNRSIPPQWKNDFLESEVIYINAYHDFCKYDLDKKEVYKHNVGNTLMSSIIGYNRGYKEHESSYILEFKKLIKNYLTNFNNKSKEASVLAIDEREAHLKELSKIPNIMNTFDDILDKIDFQYKINRNDKILYNDDEELYFIDKINNTVVKSSELSSGEKQILSLAFWAFSILENKEIRLLLLDEIDSHLHPTFCKSLITIIEEFIVPKGVKVIIATHSPATITYANEESLFLMNMPNEEPRIEKISKKEALNKLSDGLFSMYDSDNLKLTTNIFQAKEKNILLCEGITDIGHIKNIIDIYKDEDILLGVELINFGGTSKLEPAIYLLEQFNVKHNRIVILLDNDKEGQEAKKSLHKGHNEWENRCVLIDCGDIEDITQLRKNNNKLKFKNWISENYRDFLINQIEDSYINQPDGEKKNIGNNFDRFILKESINKNVINPLSNREEELKNVFKQLWLKYLKDNNEISKDLYLEFKNFIKNNIKFENN